MKSIEFGEEQLHNLQELGNQLFADENDPQSFAYVRKLSRPKIPFYKPLLLFLLPLCLLIALVIWLCSCHASLADASLYLLCFLAFYVFFLLKKALVCLVEIYQRFTPDALRNKCRFEPSCSEYMILSLEKYGLIKGLYRSIRRLKRCNIHHGGYDNP